jgi:hypothetical protein
MLRELARPFRDGVRPLHLEPASHCVAEHRSGRRCTRFTSTASIRPRWTACRPSARAKVAPGGRTVYEFDALPAGLHLYHCHVRPLAEHIAKGLYGAFIVAPSLRDDHGRTLHPGSVAGLLAGPALMFTTGLLVSSVTSRPPSRSGGPQGLRAIRRCRPDTRAIFSIQHPRREAGPQSHGTPPEFAGLPERAVATPGSQPRLVATKGMS